MVEDDLTYKSG